MEAVLFAAATSADLFAAALGLGSMRIRLSLIPAAAVAFSGALVLSLSVFLSSAASGIIHLSGAAFISKAILLMLGLYTIFGEHLKKRISSLSSKEPTSAGKRRRPPLFCAEIMNNPSDADIDGSKTISAAEGFAMGIALSADSFFTGIGAGLAGISPLRIFLLSFIFGITASILGTAAGKLLADKCGKRLPDGIIGGLILIILAFII